MSTRQPETTLKQARRSASLFAALADPTRLRLLSRLSSGPPRSISHLAKDSPLTRQAITKHLKVLRNAGLIKSTRHGREIIFKIQSARLALARQMLAQISRQWDHALARLKAFVEE
jgi:DNA-binding transcriptional ArsR family regulator